MKKTWITIVNVFIMIAMLTFVVLYSNFENKYATQRQIEHYESTTITMEHVTENYLEGEQRICDVWARYINSENMTIEDAVSFIRISHVLPNASAHIVYTDTLSGLSTRTKQDGSGDDAVSYARIGLLNDVSWIHQHFPFLYEPDQRGTVHRLLQFYYASRSGNRHPARSHPAACAAACRA